MVLVRCFAQRFPKHPSLVPTLLKPSTITGLSSCHGLSRMSSSTPAVDHARFRSSTISILDTTYDVDGATNVTPRVVDKMSRCLHRQSGHPLHHVRRRVENFFNLNFVNRVGNARFAIFDNVSPVVTPAQNFDSLLVPASHPSRSPSDSYYINSGRMLRSHTTAHDADIIRSGLDTFLVIGDVYRRDQVDASHYPVFHQIDGVHLFTQEQVFQNVRDKTGLKLFESGKRTDDKQETHTMDATKLVEHSLMSTLLGLAHHLFGKGIQYRWVSCYFPFTHPSWELEIFYNGDWLEVLGCGLLEQQILTSVGVENKIGWAFGVGLDRLAMTQYSIPDIRMLWTKDARFLDQFSFANPETAVTFKPYSQYLPRSNDLSFWLPPGSSFSSNDFYDIVRSIGGDAVVKVTLVDEFKSGTRTSHCYSIMYQMFDRPITQADVTDIHGRIAAASVDTLGVVIR